MKIVENVFSEAVLEKLYRFSRNGKQPTRTNFFNYSESVTGVSNAIFGFDLDEDLQNEVIAELLTKKMLPKKPKKLQAYIHLFSRNSYIPWHQDAIYKHTVTVYLNHVWNIDLGGLFVYESKGGLKCLMPTRNLGVSFVPPLGHTTTSTNINAPLRESLQIFVEEFE